jgi:carboxymethylenebutenolidase
MSDSMTTSTIKINGTNGDEVEAYFVEPAAASPRGGVLVIHHLPSFDREMKATARRVAELGYNVIEPNLYTRECPGMDPAEAGAQIMGQGGIDDAQALGDFEAAVNYLRSLPSSNGKVGVIGFCSGGRQTILAAGSLPVDAAVDCYGGATLNGAPEGVPFNMPSLRSVFPTISCPVLGLFGNDDQFPGPDEVNEFDELLTSLGKEHEFHRFDGVGHGFLQADRPSYGVAQSNEAWGYIADFYGRHIK